MSKLKDDCDAIGWSLRALAERIGANERTVRRWADDEFAAPQVLLDWLHVLAEMHRRMPPPKWKGNFHAEDAARR